MFLFFQKLIAELRMKASINHERHIQWANEQIVVANDSVRNLLQVLDQFDSQLKHAQGYEEKVELFVCSCFKS